MFGGSGGLRAFSPRRWCVTLASSSKSACGNLQRSRPGKFARAIPARRERGSDELESRRTTEPGPPSCKCFAADTAGLPNPQQIRNQYFDTINPDINSFAEYWKEISYGDVTISGQVTDWVQLPWAVQPKTPMNFVDLDGDGKYKYGKGEKFNNQKAMVRVDIDGDPLDLDNGPRIPEDNPAYARGARLTTSRGQPVWTAGERFLDMDGDGRWDGYDEARNARTYEVRGTI